MNGFNQVAIVRQLKRIIGVGLASLLLMFTVACSSTENTPMSSRVGSSTEPGGSKTHLRDQVQPKRDGMNGYDDDLNASTPELKGKTRALIDNAQQNIKGNATPGKVAEKAKESAKDFKDDVVAGAKQQKDGFVEGTQKGMRNLKGNLDKASKEIPEVIKEGTDKAKSSLKDSVDSAQEKVDALKG